MGIFNIQSLRDKYLSDSGVPAGQDNRQPIPLPDAAEQGAPQGLPFRTGLHV